MSYYRDLSEIRIEDYKIQLLNHHLLPSWQILREDIEQNFKKIEEAGITNQAQLATALKTAKKAKEFAKQNQIPEKYCIVLRREVRSHQPPPRNLADYPTLSEKTKNILQKNGYKTSVDIFPELINNASRKSFSEKTTLSTQTIEELTHLIDVTRLRYVSPIFATLLVAAQADTITKIAKQDPLELKNKLDAVNQEKKLSKATFGKNDALFLIQDAQLDYFQIEY